MANNNDLIQVRIDNKLKIEADKLFNELGLDMPSAIRLFLKQSVVHKSIPFTISLAPNEDTLEAIREVEKIKRNPQNYKSYTNVNDMMEDLLK